MVGFFTTLFLTHYLVYPTDYRSNNEYSIVSEERLVMSYFRVPQNFGFEDLTHFFY